VATLPQLGRSRSINVVDTIETNEFIRLSSLELCADEINSRSIQGAIAEVGVYRGNFASAMSRAFPERTFYLFDTFSGFVESQVQEDVKKFGLTNFRDFSATSESLVLAKMLNPDRCIIKKGIFPETAQGITDNFAFVSLDPDLYQPILDGLNWFWPRLVAGGYIFVHDYNNSRFPGAKQAVRDFSKTEGVSFFPLTDPFGSAVFVK
jgi:Macrocin-O-methyltransferase (TylF).